MFPDVAVKMTEVGESTGSLQDMLNSLADFYDEELETESRALRHARRAGPADPARHRDRGLLLALYLPLFQLSSVVH